MTRAVDTTGAAFLGMTLSCARCHDHKYDPVAQREYFAIAARRGQSRQVHPGVRGAQATPRTGDLKAGLVPGSAWGLATGVVTQPQGVTAMLSPGSYGHGGAYGTNLWIDPTDTSAQAHG